MSLDVQQISLDISKQPTPQQVRLGQGDANATQLVVSVFDDGIAYSLNSYNVRLEMRLPNSDNYYSVDGTRSGNVATFDIDETYAATSYGFDGFGYVDILSGDTVICSTSRFQLVVLQNAQEGADPSTAYSNGIIEATGRAIAAAEAAEGVVLQAVPLMSATVRGGAQLGEGLTIVDGKLTAASSAVPIATTTNAGIVKPDGTTITVESDGTIHGASTYELPTMSASTKGGAKVGSGLGISNDVLSVDIEPSDIGAYTTAEVDAALANMRTAILQSQTLMDAIGTVPISNGGTGATTAAGAKAAIVDGQALAPASVAATGAVSGSSISDGTGTLASLRSAILQAQALLGEFGTSQTESVSNVSVPNTTWSDVGYIELPAGAWMVNARVTFDGNTTGRRWAKLSTTSGDAANNISVVSQMNAESTTHMHVIRVFKLTAETKVYAIAYHTAGTALKCAAQFEATRIG